MKSNSKIDNKILWAIDPFQSPTYSKIIIAELKTWAKCLGCDIQPVAVISTSLLNYPIDSKINENVGFQKAAHEAVAKYILKSGAKGFLGPQIIFSSSTSNRKMAEELAIYAKSANAKMIFANTHAHQSWNPLRLGGFAETLAGTSSVPLLLVNDKVKSKIRFSKVLYPTNFSSNSKKALKVLAPLLRRINFKIQLFNQIEKSEMSLYSPIYFGYATPIDLVSLEESTVELRKKNGVKWNDYLGKLGFDSEIIIQRQEKSLSYDIVQSAKNRKSGLIAINGECNHLAQSLLGSTVRDVLLHASCPVLIVRTPFQPKKRTSHQYERK